MNKQSDSIGVVVWRRMGSYELWTCIQKNFFECAVTVFAMCKRER